MKKATISALFGCCLIAGNACAVPVEFGFGAVVWNNAVFGDGTTVQVGTPFQGSFSYLTGGSPAIVVGAAPGFQLTSYSFSMPNAAIATIGGHSIVANGLNITLFNNFGGNVEDMITFDAFDLTVDGVALPSGSFGMQLASKPGKTSALTTNTLPVHLDLAAFDAIPFTYGWLQRDGAPGGTILQFSIESISVTPEIFPISEPGSVILVSAGLAAMALRFSMRARRSQRPVARTRTAS